MILTNLLTKKKELSKTDINKISKAEEKILDETTDDKGFTKSSLKIFETIVGRPTTDAEKNIFFSNHKQLDQFPLNDLKSNKRGLHAFRVWLANISHQRNKKDHPGLDGYDDVGIVPITDFAGEQRCKQIIKETDGFPKSVHKISGVNILSQLDLNVYPTLNWLLHESGMQDHVLSSIRRVGDPEAQSLYLQNTFVQKVHNKPSSDECQKHRWGKGCTGVNAPTEGTLLDDTGFDVQKQIHSDLFFPAVKFWYFPEEVDIDKSPFMISKNTHIIKDDDDFAKENLEYWYDESIKCCDGTLDYWKTVGHMGGSLRMGLEELEERGRKLEPCPVPADTLVVGNVFGWHCRGETTEECIRLAIHGSIRVSWPCGVNPPW